ncbi:uncharacterized protein LOC141639376 [Silene latifolia]|uniref:uncharacterized protein LOC141639376 n=1 Tax=Silene latifolia TaxID=37657 RepID=UPI003D7885AA
MTALKFTQNRFSPLYSAIKSAIKSSKASILHSSEDSSSKDHTFVPSSSNTGKTKSINAIQGIPVLKLGEAEPGDTDGWKMRKGDFWTNSVTCYILGANPPWDIFEDYVYRVWDHFGIDRVSFLDNEVFIVRFTKSGGKDALLKSGYYMFDNKPVIIKPWVKDMEMVKEKVAVVPVWVKLHGIPLKFWGSCLPKIANLVGKYVKMDLDTQDKIRLSFARIMIEVPMDEKLTEKVKFLDESGNVVTVTVEYEWRPVSCTSCKGIGHEAAQCRKPGGKKRIHTQEPKKVSKPQQRTEWRPIVKPAPVPAGVQTPPILTPTNFPPLHNVRNSPIIRSTPVKQIIILNRQDGMVGVKLSGKFSNYTFMDALKNNVAAHEQRVVKWFMHNNGVGLFGLLETKLKPGTLLKRDTSICDGWSVSTNCSWHKGGRIWILWKPSLFDIQFLSYSAQHIHMLVSSQTDGKKFLFIMVYAFNGLYERVEIWNILKGIAGECNDPWLWLGDFNTVLSLVERLGGNTSDAEMEHFQDCVSICEMEDIPATGALFTWSNKQGPCDRVYSRLDRVMGNQKWMDNFGTSLAHFHPEGLFDHCPCTIMDNNTELDGKKSFKYFNMWGSAPTFKDSVAMSWTNGCRGAKMFVVVKKLKALKYVLKSLNRECFSDIENNTNIASLALETIQKALIITHSDLDLLQQEVDLSHDLKELIAARDSFLLQKAKIQWSLEGDLNTSYFHHIIKKRMMLNKVFQIEDKDGIVCTEGSSIQAAFLDYYIDLLGSHTATDEVNVNVVRRGACCSEEYWNILAQPVTPDEVKSCIFSIPKNKSPGPDGYSSQFYRDAWEIIWGDICDAVCDFFSTGKLLSQINATIITLIPKNERPTIVKHFRPISCCNVLYKAISKILCNRLVRVLPDIISKNQGAFVKGRSILENILICQDLIRMYHRGRASPRCMFKLDLQKAYDSIEWPFLNQMLEALRFPEKFRLLVMAWLSSPSYTLNLNGAHIGYFKGRRGLRQGDPISPLIFCLCMEYLTRIMDFITNHWYFSYHPICKSLKLTHLLFADDLLMFSKGDVKSIMLILRAIATFSAASGLKVNASKSEVVFSGVAEELKYDITQISGFQEGHLPFKYLGVPIQPGRLTKSDCNVLLEKIVAKVRGVIKRIEAIFWNFLWCGESNYSRTPLVSWHGICCSKKEGGLGIKEAGVWNTASVGKLVNWLYTKADRLWVLWIDHVYLKGAQWYTYVPPPDSNWNWRNICRVKGLLESGFQNSSWIATPGSYSVGAGYQWLQGSHPHVQWYKDVWDTWILPKHSFIGWLIQKKALNTRAKLYQLGFCMSDRCILCEVGEETHEHLFGDCVYSTQVFDCIEQWLCLRLNGPMTHYSKLQRKTCRMVRMAVCYIMWTERNNCRMELQLRRHEHLVTALK